MGFFKHKPNLTVRKDVGRDYLVEARRNVGDAHQATDKNSINLNRTSGTGHKQDKMQAYTAQIRSEAVQARRLAEQIDSLSQNTATQTRRKQAVMTDSTTINSGQAKKKQRRATDKPRAASVCSSFNPLHPSMELPPEQLIRLLGLESKKIRKQKRSQSAPVQQTTASPGASTSLPPEAPARSEPAPAASQKRSAQSARSTHRQREYEHASKHGNSKSRRGIWVPALASGLVCGIAVSAYLFWMQPEHGAATTAAAPATNKVSRSPVASAPRKPATKTPASTAKSTPPSAVKNDPAWLATIEARGKHLRDEAKQRLDQRLKQAVPAAPIAAVPVVTPTQAEVVTHVKPETVITDEPALVTSGEPVAVTTDSPEVMTTGVTAVEPETAAEDEILVKDIDNPTANLVSEPVDEPLQTAETPSLEESNPGELIEDPVPATNTEPTDQLRDENAPSTPAVDAPPQEGATELF
jgi:hypothetical protein